MHGDLHSGIMTISYIAYAITIFSHLAYSLVYAFSEGSERMRHVFSLPLFLTNTTRNVAFAIGFCTMMMGIWV